MTAPIPRQSDILEDLDEDLAMAVDFLQHAARRLTKAAGECGGARLLGRHATRRWARRLHRWAGDADALAELLGKAGRLSP